MQYLDVIDIFRWVEANWNNVITLSTFIATLILGAYKIRDLRREIADVEIKDVVRAHFLVGKKAPRQKYSKTAFTLNIKLFNRGREPAYVTKASLVLHESDETLEFENTITKTGHVFNRIHLGSREEIEVELTATHREFKTDREKLSGDVIFNTTTGNRKKEVEFSRYKD